MTVRAAGSHEPHSTREQSLSADAERPKHPEHPLRMPRISGSGPAAGPGEHPSATDLAGTEFPYAPESVGRARRILGGDLRRLAVAPTAADDAVLILSELVSNALRHARPLAGGTIRVAWWMEDSRVLRIAVTDGGGQPSGSEEPEGPDSADLSAADLEEVDESAVDGRGLGIVGVLADAWGVEPFTDQSAIGAPDGGDGFTAHSAALSAAHDPGAPKTVWASVRVHARHASPPPPEKHRRNRGGPPRGRLRAVRTVLTALWPGGSHGGDHQEPAAWVPRYLAAVRGGD
jgi:anti-sigma regulatory factor (Ser/Thr protein kinase)